MAEELDATTEDLVEKSKAAKASNRNVFARLFLFFKQVLQELKKVSRPSTSELVNYTGVVLAFVVVVMALIGLLDWLFFTGVVFTFSAN
jgi:preprotein translocase subunit SecE